MATKIEGKRLSDTISDVSFTAISRRYFMLYRRNVLNDLGIFPCNDYHNPRDFNFFLCIFIRVNSVYNLVGNYDMDSNRRVGIYIILACMQALRKNRSVHKRQV